LSNLKGFHMTRAIVTAEAVSAVADALVAEGLEPSLVLVQSRIGGSYTTVKRYLDAWKQARAQADAADSDTPAVILAKGQEWARSVWALAKREAQVQVQSMKEDARAQVEMLQADLAGAMAEITRLDGSETAQAATIEAQQTQLRGLELSLIQAQALASRVPELERTLGEVRSELEAVRQQATEHAVHAGRLAGEAEALRAQVRELMAAIRPTSQ
jgi:chromosome segregation ATPase